jgi:hypothetical protein
MRILRGIILSVIVTAVSWNCNDACASKRDKDIRELLDSPSVVEKFKKTQGKQTKKSKDKESPLVKEAKSFALYLNPPQKVEKRPPKIDKRTKSIVKKPTNASAKFEIVGTSYAESDPSMSLALLDIAGKGLRWIRQGEKVGHLVIEEVKPGGTIVIRDGKNTSEMTVDKPVKMSLLKGKPPDMKELSGQIESMLSASSDLKSKTSRGVRPSASDKLKARPELSEEEVKQQGLMMEQLLDQVGQMFKASEGADSSGGKDEEAIKQQELMSKQLLEQVGQRFKAPGDGADSSDTPGEKKPSAKDEVDKRRKVEKPQGETSDVQTVEEVSGLMDKLSEKLEQIKSNKNSTEVENIEKSVQQDAEHLRIAILKLKTTDVSPEDKGKLSALDKDLAKIQQNIRRSQSHKRIEKIRNKSRR